VAKINACIICFVAGIAFTSGAAYLIARNSGAKLNADLRDAKWSLGTATRTNTELAGELRQLSSDLDRASKLADDQQRIIDSQQSKLDDQQRIIDGISETIRNQGGDLRGKIKAIADGFGRLYAFYHPGAK